MRFVTNLNIFDIVGSRVCKQSLYFLFLFFQQFSDFLQGTSKKLLKIDINLIYFIIFIFILKILAQRTFQKIQPLSKPISLFKIHQPQTLHMPALICDVENQEGQVTFMLEMCVFPQDTFRREIMIFKAKLWGTVRNDRAMKKKHHT